MIYSIGIDIIENSRIEKLLKHHRHQFINRIFSEIEIAYCERKKRKAWHYAARFSCKEAFIKALKVYKNINYKEIVIKNMPHGSLEIVGSQKIKLILKKLKVQAVHLSLSHEKDFSVAVVILER